MNEIEKYIQQFPQEVQSILIEIRKSIFELVPDVIELMSYGMPGYKYNKKPLIYFAAYKNHVGIYATPSAHKEFATRLKEYKQGKGSVQFPLNRPIPFQLIRDMIEFNLKIIQK